MHQTFWKGEKDLRREGRSCDPRKARVCVNCSSKFQPKYDNRNANRFCNARCYWEWQRERNGPLSLSCANCKRVFKRYKVFVKRSRHHLCSRRCMHEFFKGERNPQWRGGSDPNRGAGWLKLAEEVRVRDGHKCVLCGKTQAENGQKLSVDHIIPWRQFEIPEKANAKTNLVSTCRRCHSKKTGRAERRYLRGDVIELQRYIDTITAAIQERLNAQRTSA